jgi:hypothetical protein
MKFVGLISENVPLAETITRKFGLSQQGYGLLLMFNAN